MPFLVVLALSVLALVSSVGAAETPVRYQVSLEQPQTQMLDVKITIPEVSGDLMLHLPTWRPGRYVILDMAGTLRDVEAFDSKGKAIFIKKIAKSSWQVRPGAAKEIVIRYRVYANSLGDRTRHVDDSHAFLSGSSIFLYADSHRSRPVEVVIKAPRSWKVATGLRQSRGRRDTWRADNYDILVDSPLEIGLHDRLSFDRHGKRYEIVIWPPGLRYDADRLQEDFGRIAEAQGELFGEWPYDRYLFLMHVGAGVRGGTEHWNSTIMQTRLESLEGSMRVNKSYRRFLGLVSHEMFHTWNVKRLRPAGIAPYDYTQENYSDLFWLAEGTTSYYGNLILARTKLIKIPEYLKKLSEAIDGYRRHPGSAEQSLTESSFDAWIKFNQRNPDQVNSTVSFYRKGALVSLLMDMKLRQATANTISLDKVMRRLYEEYPLQNGGYHLEDVRRLVEDLGGETLGEFFEAYIEGRQALNLEEALEWVGLELHQKANRAEDDTSPENASEASADAGGEIKQRATLGMTTHEDEGRTYVRTVLSDGPAYDAGVQAADELVALDGRHVDTDELKQRLESYQPGEKIELHLMRRGRLKVVQFKLASELDAKWNVRRVDAPTQQQKENYESWLAQPWPTDEKTEKQED